MKVVALAGGVGGAKLVDGLASCLHPDELTVVVNTGDDFDMYGLSISPDLDTVCYTLARIVNPETGWGLGDETWRVLDEISSLGGNPWFKLGDKDLATHLERTRLLSEGFTLSQITRRLCDNWGVQVTVLPMSNEPVRTIVQTAAHEELSFQEYFVKLGCLPQVTGFYFRGIEQALPVPGVVEAIQNADLVIICPSNPWVSIKPILAVRGIRESLAGKVVIAVSPIIGGNVIKGPAAKMYREMGIEPSALAVAAHYKDILRGFVFDHIDQSYSSEVSAWGIIPYVTDTIMKSREDRRRLAEEVLAFCRANWEEN